MFSFYCPNNVERPVRRSSKHLNLQFYKTIKSNINEEAFDIYKLNNNFSCGYLAIGNNDSKHIDIYKINSKDDIKLLHRIKINSEDISNIKYNYDSYHDCHYLKVLINSHSNIFIYKIINEYKYNLIFNLKEFSIQGRYSMSNNPIYHNLTELIFNKEQSFLIVFYVLQQGFYHTQAYINIFDFIRNNKYYLKDTYEKGYNVFENYYSRGLITEDINNIYDIKIGDKNYFGFIKYDTFYLYNLDFSNLKSSDIQYERDKKNNKADIEKIELPIKPEINCIFIPDNNRNEFFYIYETSYFYNGLISKIYKISIKYNQIIYKSEISSDKITSVVVWNEKYLLLFEDKGKYIKSFNIKTGRVEKKFNNCNDILRNGKKITINDN